MDKKKIKVFLRRSLGYAGLNFALAIASILPLSFIYRLSWLLARIAYLSSGKHRRIAEEGLEIAFGSSLDSKEKRKILIGSFEEMVKGSLESVVVISHRPEELGKNISITGKEHLKEALARGAGAIAVSAHFGNFILLAANLNAAGFPTAVVLRPLRDEKMDAFLLKKRQKFGIESIYTKPSKACVDKSLAFLRKNGVLFNLLDQNFGSGAGVFVDFFGLKAATATGPIVLALRSNSAILPVFIIRKPDNSQEIIIEPEFKIEKKENFEQTVQYNIAGLTKIIENYIRKYPAQWSWIHRRWKSRPPENK